MKIEIEEKKLVMIGYFVTLLCLLATVVDNVPLSGVFAKVKYLYVLFIAFFFLKDKVLLWNRRLFVVLGLLVVHTILYGFIFTNSKIMDNTSWFIQELIIAYVAVFFTALYIYKKDCMMEFLIATISALSILIMWAAVTYFRHFVNPIYFLNLFSRMERFRAPFGMRDVNYCGNYCLYTILFYAIFIVEWRKRNRKFTLPQICVMGTVLFFTVCMLLSTASRSAVLSLVLFAFIWFLQEKWNWIRPKLKYIIPLLVIAGILVLVPMITSGKIAEMWSDSNREGNFTINYPIFLEHGNLLHGMGYADNSGFLKEIYGYNTTAQDVYYLFIWFSTGYVGAAIILCQMIYMLFLTLCYPKTRGRQWALSLYVMMLFYCVWQVNYMNARYFTSWLHMIFLFWYVLSIKEEKSTKWIVLKK